MQTTIILGDGGLGRAVETALLDRVGARPSGGAVRVLGRPAAGRHDPAQLTGAGLVVEASHGDAVALNLAAALEAGCRQFVIATTGWAADRPRVESLLREYDAAVVSASNFSPGVVLFGRLVEAAVALFGPLEGFDPYLLEWHRRAKRDRPSGTAVDLAARIVAGHPRLARSEERRVGKECW